MGVYLLASIVGFMFIAYWAWRNDAASQDGQTQGLLRMREAAQPETESGPAGAREGQ